MSPRAAARLEALGFQQVFHYSDGKKDWMIAGLAVEGERSGEPRASDLATRDVPTCSPHQSVGGARDRSPTDGWRLCVVVNEDRVVHGRLTDDILAAAETDQRIEDVMELGPATIRPWASPASALDRVDGSGIDSILVTTDFGELLGFLYRFEVEPRVEAEPNQTSADP